MTRKKVLILLGSICLTLAMIAMACAAPAPTPAPTTPAPSVMYIKIVSGPVGGTWFPGAAVLASIIADRVPEVHASPTLGGGVSNCRDVDAGRAQIGLTYSGTALDAWEGRSPFDQKHRNLRYLGNQYIEPECLVTLKEAGIETLEDLKGISFSPGKEGFTGKLIFDRILEEAGMSYDDLGKCTLVGYTDGAMLMKDKHIDLYAMIDMPPNAGFMDVDAFFPVSILQLPDDLLDTMAEKYGMVKWTIPAGVYSGVDKDVTTVGYSCGFYCNKDLPEDIVYEITKGMWEEYERFVSIQAAQFKEHIRPENALMGTAIPLHPGAYRYYVEQGMTVPEAGIPID